MSTSHSHLMKTTRRGKPYVKDTHDLFSTLIISLPLENHRSFLKTYPNSFICDEAAANLASLKFSQSQRVPDPKDPSRIVTTTTTTTFSMTREMAKGICQHFMDSHLIENAADLKSIDFKERGVYMITPKGLHILERFITKNGINADHTLRLFAQQPICMKLLHLERRSADDEIIITKSVIEVLWRRFVGREPNATTLSDDDVEALTRSRWYAKSSVIPGEEIDSSQGMILRKRVDKKGNNGNGADEYIFPALLAVDWLLDFSTSVGPDEAAELAAHFVRYGFIALYSDTGRMRDTDFVAVVRGGGAGGGAGAIMQEAEYRATCKAVYKVTRDGMSVARWEGHVKPTPGSNSAAVSKSDLHAQDKLSSKTPRPSHSTDDSSTPPSALGRRPSLTDRLRSDFSEMTLGDKDMLVKDSHTARLKHILEEPAIRSLFREFLRANFCEENLSFWLDTSDFRRRFNTTSSAVAMPGVGKGQRAVGHQALEKHHQDLIAMAFVIYNTYLAPASPCELNIDHNLRAELISFMNTVTADKDAASKGHLEPSAVGGSAVQASQLQTLVKLYERIQNYIFRLMATDSVPKFCKTERFLSLMRSVFDSSAENIFDDPAEIKAAGLQLGSRDGTNSPPARAYITISQVSQTGGRNRWRETTS
ncbi:regulator of G protein signaling domain-domain-containing protein [Kockovaella imperatae]|uniref:Regulator of G protein signaling domain-domain-containing protein n=1 Tax=Kockovaella imperatae TaxID=4999 RepID=A0A1Y1UFN9_9TREE|nr:regulator of G protein signaling domain-domain-containing protein [Kockovaella imperatae]ORX36880.1 regulator of G protein signaling domain-domain-containing protein [Kockovaella imperatae]